MMTEDEAKTKWCPMMRGLVSSSGEYGTRCIGSACMMWRTGPTRHMVTMPGKPEEHWGWDPRENHNVPNDYYKDAQVRDVLVGDCGFK